MHVRTLILALASVLSAGAVHAEDLREFCADRPGKGTPPCIIDQGHFDIEVGVADATLQRRGGLHVTGYALGGTELRLGLSPTLEVQASWTPLIVEKDRGSPRRSGYDDLTLGFETALTPPDQTNPAMAFQAFVTAPTASHGMGAGGWSGGARLPAQLPLGADLSLSLSPEIDIARDSDGRGVHLALASAVSIDRSFRKLGLSAEAWAGFDDDPAGRTYQASVDFSAAYAVSDNVQVDAGVNFGLTHATSDIQVSAGIARRF